MGFHFSLLKPFRQTFQLNVLVLEAFVVPMSEQLFFLRFLPGQQHTVLQCHGTFLNIVVQGSPRSK